MVHFYETAFGYIHFGVRPNKIIYVFPITPAKKLGSVGTKTHFILLNYFIASKLRVGTNVKNIFALACKFNDVQVRLENLLK